MPDMRQHRGAHPDDALLFGAAQMPTLQTAGNEFAALLTWGYAPPSALKLVGDHHGLTVRQRLALARAICSDQARDARRAACLPIERVAGQDLMIDGFNLLITIEAALSGGVILRCRDGCLRDVASVHGTYRAVAETERALRLIGETLAAFAPQSVMWLFDAPVSNSGQMACAIREEAARCGWAWDAETVMNPDAALTAAPRIIVSSDSAVLDRAGRWVNLSACVLARHLSGVWMLDFGL